jgi:hypothetical protein
MPELLTVGGAVLDAMQWMVYGWVMFIPIWMAFRVLG